MGFLERFYSLRCVNSSVATGLSRFVYVYIGADRLRLCMLLFVSVFTLLWILLLKMFRAVDVIIFHYFPATEPTKEWLSVFLFRQFEEICHPYTRYCLDQNNSKLYCKSLSRSNGLFNGYLAVSGGRQTDCDNVRTFVMHGANTDLFATLALFSWHSIWITPESEL